MIARLVRFYGLPPQTLLETPLWLLDVLIEQQDRLQAEEQRMAATMALLPYVKQHERMRILKRLEKAARHTEEKESVQVIEDNPDKARAYFAALGAKVVQRGG